MDGDELQIPYRKHDKKPLDFVDYTGLLAYKEMGILYLKICGFYHLSTNEAIIIIIIRVFPKSNRLGQ